MAIHHHFQAADRGALFRTPTMKLYRRPVSAVSPANDPGDQEYTVPSWGKPIPQWSWYPLSLRWASNGQLTTLRIKVVLGQGTAKSRQRAEDYRCNPGDEIRLMQMGAGVGPEDRFEKCWFAGHIGQEAMLIQAHPDVESVTLTAYGPELLLSHKAITGMWVAKRTQGVAAMRGALIAADAIRGNAWESRLPVILNPGGQGNASEETWQLTSKTVAPLGYTASAANNKCKVFSSPGVTAGNSVSEKWTAYTALRSVVEWIDDYDVISYSRTNWSAIEQLLGSTPIGQINLTGRNLLQAMNAILVPVGFGFALEPWRGRDEKHRLIVFRLHDPVNFANVNMAPILGGNVSITSAAGRRAMVQRVDYLRDNHAVKNHVIVMGDVRLTERSLEFDEDASTRDLHPVWDQATYLMGAYAATNNTIGKGNWASDAKRDEWNQRYRLDGGDYLTYRHVFRTFAWNEDGALSDVIQSAPDLPYLPRADICDDYSGRPSKTNAHEYFFFRPRPARQRVNYRDGTAGTFEPPMVELGIVGDDDSWIKVPGGAYTLDKYRCAIHFKVKDLAEWFPWKTSQHTSSGNTLHQKYASLNFATALFNTLSDDGDRLRIRLTAGFEMDDSVYYEQRRQLDSSWPFDARALVYMPRRFKYRDIEGSISGDSEPAVIDDGEANGAMDLYGRKVRDALEDATGHGSVVLRGLHRAYSPGQGLWRLSGRNIGLSVRGRRQNKAAGLAPVIVGIAWHFTGGANKTELLLETGRMALPE